MCAMFPHNIKCHVHSFSNNENQLLIHSGCEVICVDAYLEHLKYRFILVYRPPCSFNNLTDTKLAALNDLLISLTCSQFRTIVVGDFNLPKICWSKNEYPTVGIHDFMFNCFSSLGLTQFVYEPTHFSCNNINNILDLVFSSDRLCINIDSIDPPISTSDHAIINFSISVPPSHFIHTLDSAINLTCYDWSAADYVSINRFLDTLDWHSVFGFSFDADAMWTSFKTIIWPVIDAHVPLKVIPHNRKYKPRNYPINIRRLLVRKAAVWRQLKTAKSPALYSKYAHLANECKLAITNFDSRKEIKLLAANNLGAFYKFVNNKTRSHSSVPPLKNNSNILVTSDVDKANLLNQYFESIFTHDNGITPPFPFRIGNNNPGISDITITPAIIKRILTKLKTNSAAGPDGLPPIFFHHTSQTMSYPLSHLFRSIIDIHTIPTEWKNSTIIPKFKKGASSDPSNYRPIALTCTCCKIL